MSSKAGTWIMICIGKSQLVYWELWGTINLLCLLLAWKLVSLCFSVLADSHCFVCYLSEYISAMTGCMMEGIGVCASGCGCHLNQDCSTYQLTIPYDLWGKRPSDGAGSDVYSWQNLLNRECMITFLNMQETEKSVRFLQSTRFRRDWEYAKEET